MKRSACVCFGKMLKANNKLNFLQQFLKKKYSKFLRSFPDLLWADREWGHFRVYLCFRFKSRELEKWKWVRIARKVNLQGRQFSCEWFCTKSQFDTEEKGNSEMADLLWNTASNCNSSTHWRKHPKSAQGVQRRSKKRHFITDFIFCCFQCMLAREC